MALTLSLDHRRKLLEEAPTYFSLAERVLRCCPHLDHAIHIPFPLFTKDFGTWDGEVLFSTGHALKFREVYHQHSNGILERVVNYDFRRHHSDQVTFRVDAHGMPIFDDGQLHLDLPSGVCYLDGDPRLKGYELKYFTMIDMVHLINMHLEGDTLPWE